MNISILGMLQKQNFTCFSLFSYLVPLDNWYFSNHAVVEAFQWLFISSGEAPQFTAPEGGIHYKGGVDIVFRSGINIIVTKKVFCDPKY